MKTRNEYYRSQRNLYKKVIKTQDVPIDTPNGTQMKSQITTEELFKYDFEKGDYVKVPFLKNAQTVQGIYWQISYFTFQVFLLYWKVFRK